MPKKRGKKVDIVKEASKKVYDLGPFTKMCPNCKYKHEATFTPEGTSLIVSFQGSRLVCPTARPDYPCPKCGQRLPMVKPVEVKKEETVEVKDTNGEG